MYLFKVYVVHGCVHISASVWVGACAHVHKWMGRPEREPKSSFITLHLLFSKQGLLLDSKHTDRLIRGPTGSFHLSPLPTSQTPTLSKGYRYIQVPTML